jgi:hypothetical protein
MFYVTHEMLPCVRMHCCARSRASAKFLLGLFADVPLAREGTRDTQLTGTACSNQLMCLCFSVPVLLSTLQLFRFIVARNEQLLRLRSFLLAVLI